MREARAVLARTLEKPDFMKRFSRQDAKIAKKGPMGTSIQRRREKVQKMNVQYRMANVQFPRENVLVSEFVLFHLALGHS
jgi:hypothetical protein